MSDVIIVGGGLAGLYAAFLLSKDRRILLLESEGHVGGRVYTAHPDNFPPLEAGAARFNPAHKRLHRILRHFKLASKAVRIPDDPPDFLPATSADPTEILQRVTRAAKRLPRTELMNQTITDVARGVLSPAEVKFLEASFGYSSELKIMNAWDALHLFESYAQPFSVLGGGLSQLTECLRRELEGRGVTILSETPVVDVQDDADGFLVRTKGGTVHRAPVCILALPRPALARLPRFAALKPMLEHIKTSPLCRIYSRLKRPGSVTHKFTTDSDLRMVIPISKDVIMSSYTDGVYAKRWKAVHDREGIKGVDRKLKGHYIDLGLDVPFTDHKFFYWDHGVGYWGVGADSKKISSQILQPFPGKKLFVCGEHYSHVHQQWMEGALETAEQVVAKLSKRRKTRKAR